MRKHAYLIMAHNNFEQLKFLLGLLDDERNDIFLMIDKKATISPSELKALESACSVSKVRLVERIDVRWGDYSLIKAEMILLEEAGKRHYEYYHLLSGSDLPLVSQDKIHAFFDQHPNKIFISNVSSEIKEKNQIDERVKYKHYFNRMQSKNLRVKLLGKFYQKADRLSVKIQKILKKDWLAQNGLTEVGYASQWFTIDDETAQMLIKNEKYIEHVFKRSVLCDEVFIPTMISREKMEDKLYLQAELHDRPDELQGNLRYINWWEEGLSGSSPYVWQDGDEYRLEDATELGHFFARKFDLEKSPELKKFIRVQCAK